MAPVGTDPAFAERHALKEQLLTGLWLFLWGVRFVLDMFWWRRMETRTVFLPRRTVRGLRVEAMSSLGAGAEADAANAAYGGRRHL